MDLTLTQWLNAPAGSNGILDLIMIGASDFGIPLLVLLVVAQWWSKENRPYARHTCVTAGLAFLIGLGLNQLVLLFVHRLRPYDAGISHLIVGPSSDWSFPSDHAAASLAIAATFLLHGFRRLGLALLIGALLICVSRVYVGVHYASDVVGGMVTGIAAAIGVSLLYLEGNKVDRLITKIL